jgi:hypothetical protein
MRASRTTMVQSGVLIIMGDSTENGPKRPG